MIKAIFSDLDNTLLSSDQSICRRNIEAIDKARKLGVKFLFCTGRLPFCYEVYNYLGLTDYVCANGAIIIKDNQKIKKSILSMTAKETILDYAMKNNLYTRIFADDFLYLLNNEKGQISNIYAQSRAIEYDEVKTIIQKELCKISFVDKNHDYLLGIKKELQEMNLDADVEFSSSYHLECNVKGESKAKGLKEYLEYAGIDIKDTLSIGDSYNDLSMLKITGVAACPINAEDDIKKICHYVSPLNNNEGAVGDIIEKYVLNI